MTCRDHCSLHPLNELPLLLNVVSLGSDTDHPGDLIDAEPSSSVWVYGVRIHITGIGGRRPGIYHTPPWLANAKGAGRGKKGAGEPKLF